MKTLKFIKVLEADKGTGIQGNDNSSGVDENSNNNTNNDSGNNDDSGSSSDDKGKKQDKQIVKQQNISYNNKYIDNQYAMQMAQDISSYRYGKHMTGFVNF